MSIFFSAIFTILVFTQATNVSFAQKQRGLLGGFRDKTFEPDKKPKNPVKNGQENNSPREEKIPSGTTKPHQLTLDERIDDYKKEIANMETVRRQPIRRLKDLKEIRQLADRYREQVEENRKNYPREFKGPGLPPRDLEEKFIKSPYEKNGWKIRFRRLDRAMQLALKRLKQLEKGKINPRSTKGRAAILEMNRLLFEVNLAGRRMKLEELRWERELKLPALKIEIVNSKNSVDLYYEELAPKRPRKRSGGGGLAGRLQRDVVDRMDDRKGGGLLKASLHVTATPRPWISYGYIFNVKGDPKPTIDKKIKRQSQLHKKAKDFVVDMNSITVVLTISHREWLRENGHIALDVSRSRMFPNLGLWKIKGKPKMILRLKAREVKLDKADIENRDSQKTNDEEKKPALLKPSREDADDTDSDSTENGNSSDENSDSEENTPGKFLDKTSKEFDSGKERRPRTSRYRNSDRGKRHRTSNENDSNESKIYIDDKGNEYVEVQDDGNRRTRPENNSGRIPVIHVNQLSKQEKKALQKAIKKFENEMEKEWQKKKAREQLWNKALEKALEKKELERLKRLQEKRRLERKHYENRLEKKVAEFLKAYYKLLFPDPSYENLYELDRKEKELEMKALEKKTKK